MTMKKMFKFSEAAWDARNEALQRLWRVARWRCGIAARKLALAIWAALYAAAFAFAAFAVGAAVAWCAAVEEDCDAAKAAAWKMEVVGDGER